MKFVHRLGLVSGVIAGVLLISSTLNVLMLWRSSLPHSPEDTPVDLPRQAPGGGGEQAGAKVEEWKSVEELEETLGLLQGHLAVLRKGLDYSNGSESRRSPRAESGRLLYERLRADPRFQVASRQHRDTLLKLARALRADDPEAAGSKNLAPAEEGPQSRGARVAADAQARRAPETPKDDNHQVTPNVTLKMVETLQGVVERKLNNRKRRRRRKGISLTNAQVRGWRSKEGAWQRFHAGINQFELYGEFDQSIDQLVKELTFKTVIGLKEIGDLGTQIKLVFKLNYGGKALFKPMRFSKDAEADPNHFIFDDFERHHAEIAAFHLDRVLNFRRVPPVSGRYVNLTRDIEYYASSKLRKTFFTSPAKNRCFHGVCDTYCDSGQAVCGHPHVLEGSLAAWLPDDAERTHWSNPWAQTYSMRHDTVWRNDPKYCSKVKAEPPYNEGRRLLDVMDMVVFDFLAGNMDRHHYHTFEDFGNYTFLLLFDNGRGFGRPRHDELGLLAGVQQCCLIRASTLRKLLSFHAGAVQLSEAMRESLAKDILSPVLNELHLAALDRRLDFILETIYHCGFRGRGTPSWDEVVLDDGF